MTSKDGLNELKELIKHEHLENVIDTEKYFNDILRDLEVLKILKELFSNSDYLTILLKTNYLYKIKDETKLNLIKEWLKQ